MQQSVDYKDKFYKKSMLRKRDNQGLKRKKSEVKI
jgi:hypothetical protein